MSRPFYPQIAPWAASGLRRIFSSAATIRIPLSTDDRDAECIVLPPARNDTLLFLFEVRWGEDTMLIGISSQGLFERSPVLADLNLLQLPRDAAAVVIETVLEDFMEGLEQVSELSCRIIAVKQADDESETEAKQKLDFIFKGSMVDIQGIFYLDENTLIRIAELTASQTSTQGVVNGLNLATISLPVNLIVGQSSITTKEYLDLEIGDIVFFQQYAEDEILIQIARFYFYSTKTDETTFHITGRARMNMDEQNTIPGNETGVEEQKALIRDTSDIPVQLEFSIGKTSIPLGDLEQITSGYVFEIGGGFEQPVTLIANGSVIGRGEIIDVDGRLGVRIVECKVDAGI